MKRSFLFGKPPATALVGASTALVAATYGLVRLAYGLYLPEMQSELQFNTTVAGLISGGASVAYCLGAAAAFLAAARNARALVVCAGASAAAGATGMALSIEGESFALFAILSSAGAGLASPALVRILQRNLEPRSSTGAQSVANAGTGPGLVAAGVLALALLPHWRSAWFVAAIVTAVATVLVLTFDQRQQDQAQTPTIIPPRNWFLTHRRLIAAALLMGAGSAAVWNYGRILLVQSGPASTSVLAWVALGAGGTAVIATARRTSTVSPRIVWTLSTGFSALTTVAIVVAPDHPYVALPACFLFGWGYTAGTGALIAWTTQLDRARAPAGTALLFIVLILGQALGAAGAGKLIDLAGKPTAFLASAASAGAAALLGITHRSSDARGRQKARAGVRLQLIGSRTSMTAARKPRS